MLTWDPAVEPFWLVRDYFPEFVEMDREQFPAISAYTEAFGPRAQIEVTPLPVTRDCVDGFLGAYWARPAAYLDPAVRAGISSFARADPEEGLARLRADLESGAWHVRNAHLQTLDALELGYRIVVADLTGAA
jgi:hypothetical protein